MPLLTREQILEAKDTGPETVPVPEWGGDVLVWGLDGFEQTEYSRNYLNGDDAGFVPKEFRPALLAMCIRNEASKPLFTEADIQALGRKSGAAVSRVYAIAARLSGLGGAAAAAKND